MFSLSSKPVDVLIIDFQLAQIRLPTWHKDSRKTVKLNVDYKYDKFDV